MQLHELILNCPNCNSWYTRKTTPESEFIESTHGLAGFKEVFYCNCHGGKTELKDAHEWDILTPYAELKLEMLKEELYYAEQRVEDIERKIKNIRGE